VAFRTLKRRVCHAGETEAGQPVLTAAGTRLVLPAGSRHFLRLIRCRRCGRELAWAQPVMSRSSLSSDGGSHLCDRCSMPPSEPRRWAEYAGGFAG
jgi:hypothetical protein